VLTQLDKSEVLLPSLRHKVHHARHLRARFDLDQVLSGAQNIHCVLNPIFVSNTGAKPDMAKLLLVEDDPFFAYAARRHLEKMGHTVVAATNSDQAIQAFQEKDIDLAVIDLLLPDADADGLAVAREIRSKQPSMPVILVTAYPDRLAARALVPGVVLTKPLELSTLGQAVTSGLLSKSS
jgi:CheY-like chemotaxis protein